MPYLLSAEVLNREFERVISEQLAKSPPAAVESLTKIVKPEKRVIRLEDD